MVHKLSLASGLVVLFSREIFARTAGKTLPWNDIVDFDRKFSDKIGDLKAVTSLAYSYDAKDSVVFEANQVQQSGHDDEKSELVSAEHDPVSAPESGDTESQLVGVKPHSIHRKSNAVGDPDGEGSDSDDDDSDFDDSDWESIRFSQDQHDQKSGVELDSPSPQVQVQLEVMQDPELDDESSSTRELSSRRSGGGVGLRFGQKLHGNRRKNRMNTNQEVVQFQKAMVDAWNRFVFAPPTSMSILKDNARKLDGDSKLRLDRRTLYGCLLLEWRGLWTTERRFLQPSTSQALQAALSLATQPSWRKSLSQASALRLYDSQHPDQGSTLAMQETIALGLVSVFVVRFAILYFY